MTVAPVRLLIYFSLTSLSSIDSSTIHQTTKMEYGDVEEDTLYVSLRTEIDLFT